MKDTDYVKIIGYLSGVMRFASMQVKCQPDDAIEALDKYSDMSIEDLAKEVNKLDEKKWI